MLLKILLLTILFPFFTPVTGIHGYSVPVMEGGSQALSAYEGKKILVITLPLQQNASSDSMLYSLDTLAAAHSTTLKVIAVPSYEDGYTLALKDSLNQWYRSKLGSHILVTAGLYTRKSSEGQHDLFKWLTNVNLNEHFDVDVQGPGYKYFARANGELYSVLVPETRITSKAVQTTLRIQ